MAEEGLEGGQEVIPKVQGAGGGGSRAVVEEVTVGDSGSLPTAGQLAQAAECVRWTVDCDGEDWGGSRAPLGWWLLFLGGGERAGGREWRPLFGCVGLPCRQLYVEMCTTTR